MLRVIELILIYVGLITVTGGAIAALITLHGRRRRRQYEAALLIEEIEDWRRQL